MVVFGYVIESAIEVICALILLILNGWQMYANHLAYRTWRVAVSSMDLAANPNGARAVGEAAATPLVSNATAMRVTPKVRYGHMFMVAMTALLLICTIDPEYQLSRIPASYGMAVFINMCIVLVDFVALLGYSLVTIAQRQLGIGVNSISSNVHRHLVTVGVINHICSILLTAPMWLLDIAWFYGVHLLTATPMQLYLLHLAPRYYLILRTSVAAMQSNASSIIASGGGASTLAPGGAGGGGNGSQRGSGIEDNGTTGGTAPTGGTGTGGASAGAVVVAIAPQSPNHQTNNYMNMNNTTNNSNPTNGTVTATATNNNTPPSHNGSSGVSGTPPLHPQPHPSSSNTPNNNNPSSNNPLLHAHHNHHGASPEGVPNNHHYHGSGRMNSQSYNTMNSAHRHQYRVSTKHLARGRAQHLAESVARWALIQSTLRRLGGFTMFITVTAFIWVPVYVLTGLRVLQLPMSRGPEEAFYLHQRTTYEIESSIPVAACLAIVAGLTHYLWRPIPLTAYPRCVLCMVLSLNSCMRRACGSCACGRKWCIGRRNAMTDSRRVTFAAPLGIGSGHGGSIGSGHGTNGGALASGISPPGLHSSRSRHLSHHLRPQGHVSLHNSRANSPSGHNPAHGSLNSMRSHSRSTRTYSHGVRTPGHSARAPHSARSANQPMHGGMVNIGSLHDHGVDYDSEVENVDPTSGGGNGHNGTANNGNNLHTAPANSTAPSLDGGAYLSPTSAMTTLEHAHMMSAANTNNNPNELSRSARAAAARHGGRVLRPREQHPGHHSSGSNGSNGMGSGRNGAPGSAYLVPTTLATTNSASLSASTSGSGTGSGSGSGSGGSNGSFRHPSSPSPPPGGSGSPTLSWSGTSPPPMTPLAASLSPPKQSHRGLSGNTRGIPTLSRQRTSSRPRSRGNGSSSPHPLGVVLEKRRSHNDGSVNPNGAANGSGNGSYDRYVVNDNNNANSVTSSPIYVPEGSPRASLRPPLVIIPRLTIPNVLMLPPGASASTSHPGGGGAGNIGNNGQHGGGVLRSAGSSDSLSPMGRHLTNGGANGHQPLFLDPHHASLHHLSSHYGSSNTLNVPSNGNGGNNGGSIPSSPLSPPHQYYGGYMSRSPTTGNLSARMQTFTSALALASAQASARDASPTLDYTPSMSTSPLPRPHHSHWPAPLDLNAPHPPPSNLPPSSGSANPLPPVLFPPPSNSTPPPGLMSSMNMSAIVHSKLPVSYSSASASSPSPVLLPLPPSLAISPEPVVSTSAGHTHRSSVQTTTTTNHDSDTPTAAAVTAAMMNNTQANMTMVATTANHQRNSTSSTHNTEDGVTSSTTTTTTTITTTTHGMSGSGSNDQLFGAPLSTTASLPVTTSVM